MKITKLILVLALIGGLSACESTTDFYSEDSGRSTISPIHSKGSNSIASPTKHKGIATFRRATARYHEVAAAVKDGYEQILPCTENPEGPGGLGVVYARLDRFDTDINLNKPEILFYEPEKNGDLRLVGGEPVVPIELWNESNPPSLFGREFHRNEEHGLFGLHMWVWKHNPNGVFAFWHPGVSCKYAQ